HRRNPEQQPPPGNSNTAHRLAVVLRWRQRAAGYALPSGCSGERSQCSLGEDLSAHTDSTFIRVIVTLVQIIGGAAWCPSAKAQHRTGDFLGHPGKIFATHGLFG